MTDTVGFIRKLPHQLVEAFKATLEETVNADLILHVVDASVPEDELDEMMRAVDEVLEEIGAGDKPRLLVLNKIDQLDEDDRRAGGRRATATRCSSPRSPARACEELRQRIEQKFRARPRARGAAGALRARRACCRSCTSWRVTSSARTPAEGVRVKARVPAAVAERLRPYELNGRPPAE